MRTIPRGLVPAFLLCFLFTDVLLAQENAREEEIRRLEQRLEQLSEQVDSLREELQQLRGTAPIEDLTAVEPLEPAPAEQAEQLPETLDPQLIPNVAAPGASSALNPSLAAIGNFVAFLGSGAEETPAASLEEVELSLQAYVDPYARANFFIGISEEGAEVEEGYINFISLPQEFTAKVGKMKANFGKTNLLHTHQRPWVDVPLVLSTFFGDEGLADSGVSVSRLFPTNAGLFLEATGEVFSGNAEGIFEAEEKTDLFYLGHLKLYRDLTENTNLELGGSYATGRLPEVGGSNQFAGVDLTFRYKPLQRAIYSSFISRTELIYNDRNDQPDRAFGFYTSADYQFSRRWFAGIRLDQVDHPDDPGLTDQSGSFTLTFWPSEFSQLRAQFRHINFDQSRDANEVLLQLNFSIGAHGAHSF